MSVPLQTQRRSELPLIAFTACEPAAFGAALFGFCAPVGVAVPAVAWLLASIGMLASIGHLARPLRAPRSLANLRSSWLSREILAVGAFWALLSAWLAAAVAGQAALAVATEAVSCLVGAALLYIIARAYRVSTRPAWCGSEGLMELWACALGAGPAIVLAGAGAEQVVAALLAVAGFCGLALDIASHRRRRRRLEALVGESDERVPLTLERYAGFWPTVKRLWLAEGVLCVLTAAACAVALTGAVSVAAAMATLAAVGQLLVHACHRNLFYEVPVQVRWVARLLK